MILRALGALDVAGMYVMEVAPPYDHADITAIAGATVAMYMLGLRAERIHSGRDRSASRQACVDYLAGNLAEWTLDAYQSTDEPCYRDNPVKDPVCREASPTQPDGVAVRGFAVESPSLEDVFVSLTGRGFDVSG